MVEFYDEQNIDEEIKIVSDEEIKLILSFGLPNSKQYYYVIYDKNNNDKIGHCGLRLEHNEANEYLGNIEYEIFENKRGHNYAEKASRLLAQVALHLGADNLKITARPDNISSIRTIEKLKAKFVEVRKVPKHTRLYKSGSKEVSIYEWNLKQVVNKSI